MWREMAKFGKKLVDHGHVESHFGNMSMRLGDKILITRTGAMLDEITENSVVEVDITQPSSFDLVASSEAIVHRAIYQNTSALAIIHAHSPYAVVESLKEAERGVVVPVDSEGQYFLHEVPIVRGGIGTKELADNLVAALSEHKAAIVYSHGTFAAGKIVEEAYVNTTMVEHSCKLKYLLDLATSDR